MRKLNSINLLSNDRSAHTTLASFNLTIGVYLDDLTWRVVGRLINELFSSNKIAMGTILMNAAGNNASAAVIGTAVSVVSGVAGAASSTAKFAAGTAASTVKGVTEEFHTYNAKTALLGATALGTKVVHSVSHTFHKVSGQEGYLFYLETSAVRQSICNHANSLSRYHAIMLSRCQRACGNILTDSCLWIFSSKKLLSSAAFSRTSCGSQPAPS